MNTQVICECPICFDVIGETNNITTECGHKFHASCLMTNVSCNGFNCPCCRSQMATVSSDADSDDDDDSDDGSESIGSETDSYSSESTSGDSIEYLNERNTESILRGFRFFMNQVNNAENNQEDEVDEVNDVEIATLPTVDFITDKLIANRISLTSIVGAMMSVHANYKIDTKMVEYYSNVWETLHTLVDSNTDKSRLQVVSSEMALLIIEERSNITIRGVKHFTTIAEIRQDLELNYPSNH